MTTYQYRKSMLKATLWLVLSVLLLLAVLTLRGAVTNSYTLHNPNGTAYTNIFVMTSYPPQANSVVVVGTNIIIGGGYSMTNQPNGSGQGTVVSEPGQYKVFEPANSTQFYVNIGATNPIPDLSALTVNTPVIFTPNSFFALFTNAFGGVPVAATYGGVTNALGYAPATNIVSTNTIVFVSAVSGATNGSGYVTNITTTLTTNTLNYVQ
jgi:hypothetical protein